MLSFSMFPVQVPRTVTPTTLTKDVLDQLRAADHIVTQVLTKYNLLRTLAQVPVVLFPVSFGGDGLRSIGIRAFITRDFMTGGRLRAALHSGEWDVGRGPGG
jgi:GMP synthase PP-ATPase subunit